MSAGTFWPAAAGLATAAAVALALVGITPLVAPRTTSGWDRPDRRAAHGRERFRAGAAALGQWWLRRGTPAGRAGPAPAAAPAAPAAGIARALLWAGMEREISLEEWMGIRLGLAILGGIAGWLGAVLLLGSLAAAPAMGAGLALAGWLLPGVWLAARRARHQAELRAALPELVDHLTMATGAGLNVRQALEMAAGEARDRLHLLLARICDALILGASLREAVDMVLDEVEPGPVRLVLDGLADAERLGTRYAGALEEQSRFVQALRQQEVERRLNLLPLKLMAVGVLFLLPPIFIVIVVPNLLALLRAGW